MPIPALAGIPWLASVLAGLFTSIFTYLAQYFSKRIAIILVAIAFIATLTLAFFAAINTIAGALIPAVPSTVINFMSHFMPSNAVACLSAVFAAQVTRWIYEWNIKIIRMKTQA